MTGQSSPPPGFDGGYFATATPSTFAAPHVGAPGYGPTPGVPGGSDPRPPLPVPGGPTSLPTPVVISAAFLLLAGVGALWSGLTVLVSLNSLPFAASPVGDSLNLRGWLLLLNGAGNLYLAFQLLRGWNPARVLTTVVCGWWLLYWLYQTSQASRAFGELMGSPFGNLGGLGFMITLGLLLLAGWAAATAGLLWLPGVSPHFNKWPARR